MSEQTTETGSPEVTEKSASKSDSVKLKGLFAFKIGMTQVVNDKGEMECATVLQYEPWIVSQIKTKDNDGYEAIQIACRPRKEKRSPKPQAFLKKAGFKGGAYFVREIREKLPEGVAIGSVVAIDS